MADTPIPINQALATFDALTDEMHGRVLVDNIFQEKPFWMKLRQQLLPVDGSYWMPNVELKGMSGVWYTRAGKIGDNLQQTFAPEIATSAKYKIKYWILPVLLPAQDVDEQGTRAKLVDLLTSYIKNATKSSRKDLSTAVFNRSEVTIGTGQGTNAMETLDQACWYGTTYGGIDPTVAGQETWEAHAMYGATSGAVILAVSPTWDNIELCIDETVDTCGERPDLVLVSPEHFRALRAQITANDYAVAKAANAGSDVVRWGFSALWCQDVPIVKDRDCYRQAFVAGQATCVAAKGHDAYGINFKHFKLAYNRKRSFQWYGPWHHTRLDYDAYLNVFYVWVTTGSDARRTLFRMVNVDPTQQSDDFGIGSVRLPGAAA